MRERTLILNIICPLLKHQRKFCANYRNGSLRVMKMKSTHLISDNHGGFSMIVAKIQTNLHA